MPRLRPLAMLLVVTATALTGVAPATPTVPRVAIIDSGINPVHPEFRSGQVAAWRDFVHGADAPYDDHGHGTSVAGRVAGETTGAYPAADLIVAKVLDSTDRTSWTTVIAAMDWAVASGADVITVALWVSLPNPVAAAQVGQAIARATEQGTLVVWIAGNGGDLDPWDDDLPIPSTVLPGAGSTQVLVVGAADDRGNRAAFSQHEPNVLAPGVSVRVARGNGYVTASGTSYAAPYVAGMAAAMLHAGAPRDPDFLAWSLRHIADDNQYVTYVDEGYGVVGPQHLSRAIAIGAGEEPPPALDARDGLHLAFLAARAPQGGGPPLAAVPPR